MRRQVTKQMILLTACLVFALALSGTVAAEDSQGGGLEDSTTLQSNSEQTNSNNNSGSNDVDPRIYGVIKDNDTPANGATITIKNPTNNSVIATGTTNSTGEYDISFLSSLTEFKVEIAYSTYLTFVSMLTPTGSPIPTAELNHTFAPSKMLQPTNMVVVGGAPLLSTVNMVNTVYKELLIPEGYYFNLKIFTTSDLSSQAFLDALKTANILWINGGPYAVIPSSVQMAQLLSQMPADGQVFSTHNLGTNLTRNVTYLTGLYGVGSLSFANLNNDNIKRTMLYIMNTSKVINIIASEFTIIPRSKDFIAYHPDTTTVFSNRTAYMDWYISSGKYNANAPTVGIMVHTWDYFADDMAVPYALIRQFEALGVNVIPLVQPEFGDGILAASREFFMVNGTPAIDVLIPIMHGPYGSTNVTQFFNQLNVPVINPVLVQGLLDDYLKSSKGLTQELAPWVVLAETQGRVEPIMIGGRTVVYDPVTDVNLLVFKPYQPGIDQLVGRTLAWANLKHENNSTKNIALIYMDNTHDEKMPVAYGLNLPESIVNIIQAMDQAGYDFGSLDVVNLTSDVILALINDHGRNPLNYTQALLASLVSKGAVTISRVEYLQMYSTLPASLRAKVEEVWGPPIGDVMTLNDQIVLPGIMLGNIFLGPQPIWKWNGTMSSLDSSETLPPTHQYIAFYLWLQNKFGADAVVQLGQHGTLELLPGHNSGMTEDDWPNTLIGNMPFIYLFKMDAANENILPKRRAYAVMISYLIPPLTEVTLYASLQEMHDLIGSYDDAVTNNDTARQEILKNQIWEKINSESGLSERLNITQSTSFNIVYIRLHNYLHSLQQLLTSDGLHTFGELPDNETLENFIDALISFDPDNRVSRRDEIRNLIIQSVNSEMPALLDALNGGYIEPAVARDPVRSLFDSMPTGRNIYPFDPTKFPDTAAKIIGKKAVEEMLKRYQKDNGGSYPETVAMSVSTGELINTNGQSIASIFYLLGVEPLYNSNFVVGTTVIPLSQLNRSRIDVLVHASADFRDTCPYIMSIIDDAIKQVALLNESTDQNYVRKHYLEMMASLETELLSQGLSAADAHTQAERLARSRIFSQPPGANPHAVGVGRVLRSNDDWTDNLLAETYLGIESYIYGKDVSGISGVNVLEKLLRTVDTTIAITNGASASVSAPGSEIIFMVRYLTGENIPSYVIKTTGVTATSGTPTVFTAKEYSYDGLVTTLFNPEWKQGLMDEGPAGHTILALSIRNVLNTDAQADVLSNGDWQRIANTYLFDQNMYSQYDASAAKMIANTIYQANRRGLMQLSYAQAARLSQILGIPVASNDPTQSSSTSGSVTGSSGTLRGSQTGSVGTTGQQAAGSSDAGTQSAGDAGKSYEVTKAAAEGSTDAPWGIYAIVGVLSVLALAGVGFFLKGGIISR